MYVLLFSHSVVSDSMTLWWTAARQTSLSFTIFLSLLKLMSIELMMPFNHLILCHPLLLPSIFPASGSFPMCWLFTSGGQSIGDSASVLPMNIHGWFPLALTGLISMLSKGLSRVFSNITVQKHHFFITQPSFGPTFTSVYAYWKNHSFDYTDFVGKVMSLLFNTLSRFAIAFLPRNKHLWISWLQSPSAVILEPRKIKYVTVSVFPHLFAM